MTEQHSPCQAFSATTDLRLVVSNTLLSQPLLPILPDTHFVEQAKAIVLAAQFLYHISVTYHPLDDGIYEVLPVGDNDFTTITSATHLCDAILGQITCFMESPVFIEQQLARLAVR